MTVQVETPRNTFVGDGVEDTFAFTFRILDNSHLVVEVEGATQTEITHYTLENLTNVGGDVVFVAAPANLADIAVYRAVPKTQLDVYTAYDSFPALTHETALDKLTMIAQDNTDSIVNLIPAGVAGQVLSTDGDDLVFVDQTGGDGLGSGILHSDLLSVGGVLTVNYVTEQSVYVVMDENITSMVFNGLPAARLAQIEFEILQDNPAKTWAWPAAMEWIGGVEPDLSVADGKYLVRIRTRDEGTGWIGTFGEDFS
jgi:hypothetical protein